MNVLTTSTIWLGTVDSGVAEYMPYYKNIPIASSKNRLLALLAQCDGGFVGGYGKRRRYTRAKQIEKLAIDKYKKNGKGITFNDLLSTGLTSNKKQS